MCAKRLPLKKPRSLSSYKGLYFRRLNNIYIAAQATCAALEAYATALAKEPRKAADRGKVYRHFQVPSGGKPTARIRRELTDVEALIGEAIREGEYQKSLVLAVSITEDYIVNILKMMLRAHPDRITRGWSGADGNRPQMLVDDFVSKVRDELIDELIWKKLNGKMYKNPAEYLKYLSQIVEVKIPIEALGAFLEVKATRDIVVHANGFANETYVAKAGPLARAQAGHLLPVSDEYFNAAVSHMKSLIGQIHDAVCLKYANDAAVSSQADRFMD